MKIFCEDTLTCGEAFFDDVADVTWFSGNQLNAEQLIDAEALFIRSTTKVTPELLQQAEKLQLVATATAGTDHMDLEFLKSRGIEAYSAAGCNAIAVAEYVIAGIVSLAAAHHLSFAGKKLGIVGAGHVGTALAERAVHLGFDILLCDPPLQAAGDQRPMVALAEILDCDVISLHVPLVTTGQWPTLHMFNDAVLSSLKPHQILVNACRGEVVDNQALSQLLQKAKPFFSIFDVWENEPDIDFALAQKTDFSTQHIAGHTLEGKVRGTDMIYNFAAQRFNWPAKSMWDYLPEVSFNGKSELQLSETDGSTETRLHKLIEQVYSIETDTANFRNKVHDDESFRYSRKHYGIRREFSSVQVNTGNSLLTQAIYGLGFKRAE
ncbi:4-phosphoerythronate dehydrogenase [Planctobacterium marinum]|uniref:4-phosphoerythronate dehydrogenase n=1 Tax=Planctobacterium marinum TaxID=1631968 RepID=UPI001E373634|nr:4-phosphoerythronate dehydrogenase [Planctobacterium marinum]MCC2605885.1 4-phosphoerythronate dehydrogenase [Planctobacterium marinum]